ncbi:hypothetical protein ACFQ3Z_23730 [Streptomyces nogalater]
MTALRPEREDLYGGESPHEPSAGARPHPHGRPAAPPTAAPERHGPRSPAEPHTPDARRPRQRTVPRLTEQHPPTTPCPGSRTSP